MFDEPEGAVRNGPKLERGGAGKIRVAAGLLWGAGTQPFLVYFTVREDLNPREFIRTLVIVKRVAAKTNQDRGKLEEGRANAILQAAGEAAAGKLDGHLPLPVWLSSSGTQLDMNVNEVLANPAIQIPGRDHRNQKPGPSQ